MNIPETFDREVSRDKEHKAQIFFKPVGSDKYLVGYVQSKFLKAVFV